MNDKIFEACIEKIGASHLEEYLESCRIDVCSYHNDPTNHHSVFCQIIEGFATECETVGIFVNWREISQCPMKCKENEEFQHKTSSCQPSCANRSPMCTGSSQGCVCRQGFILSGEQCVPETECGCIDNKIYMKVNEEIISADCKTKKICKPGNEIVTENITPCGENSHCGIQRGKYACVCNENFILQKEECVHAALKPCICKVSGDPHYRAFDGQMIHFMGTCNIHWLLLRRDRIIPTFLLK
ncbi:zonadhesin-like [Octopus sinensis]|uniref:Zonadhesin-like n=1 Tax=Octopus sinensis TaxID=2607531 RepID=A0A6P7S569_9MOLL|nr:zonadhesin-like [Octopus sinensis]